MTAQAASGTSADFLIVTERGGEPVSAAQLDRFHQRYLWAGAYCRGKDVLEMACGTGPGLGHLLSVSASLAAGDIAESVLGIARAQYGERVALQRFDATKTPYASESFDVIVFFEAIYYVPDITALITEVRRLLRPDGRFLIATANKDLIDFNPSPFSQAYYNPPELHALLQMHGFETRFFGGSPAATSTARGRATRALKRFASRYRLIPGSMAGKRLLKRLVFGKLVAMPVELDAGTAAYVAPTPIESDRPDTSHLVLYCAARKR